MKHRWFPVFALTVIAWSLSGCGDGDSVAPEPTFDNPSTLRVVNRLAGPVLFVYAKPCGTQDWGGDLFRSNDPIEGTLQPGNSKDFTVEAGCYDLQAVHLETTEPGPLIEKFSFNQAASPVTPIIWTLEEESADPT
ncbi:hypothetical protein [Candidatus Palauibacter sp.]|uniref:hypothetical protein n=1 Tax=Candidatus Palauibacter sp. TaxID=3101350 RepID=UPI003B01DEB6